MTSEECSKPFSLNCREVVTHLSDKINYSRRQRRIVEAVIGIRRRLSEEEIPTTCCQLRVY